MSGEYNPLCVKLCDMKEQDSRNEIIRTMAARGMSLTEIAKVSTLTPQRIGQILEPMKSRARQAVNRALNNGRLARPDKCQRCGEISELEAHHANYERPLAVEWYCIPCHTVVEFGEPEHKGDDSARTGLPCPACGTNELSTVDTRPAPGGLRRRRQCLACQHRFTTIEQVRGKRQPLGIAVEHDQTLTGIPNAV